MGKEQKIIRNQLYIDGRWVKGGLKEQFEVQDKYNGELLSTINKASSTQMDEACAAADAAFADFSQWSAGKRKEYLVALIEKIKSHREELVELIIREAGKPRSYAEDEISRCITTAELGAEACTHFGGSYIPMDFGKGEGRTAYSQRFPRGPVLCITPFNFPLNLLLHKVIPALATGCTMVVKPADKTPLSALALAHFMHEVDYPKGVINVLLCDGPKSEQLIKDERLKTLSFTGSDKIGWHIKSISGKKKVVLELGGNAALIVDAQCDLKQAAERAIVGAYLYAGQICISTQRIIVQREVYDAFVEAFLSELKKIKSGDPKKSEVSNGPMINQEALERIHEWVVEATAKGASVLVGGEILDKDHCIYAPTLLENVDHACRIFSEEAFAPVAILERASTFEEAIEMANNSKYGLQIGVFTDLIQHMQYAHRHLNVGGVIVNDVPGFRIDNMPYGGVKDSGFGREGIHYAMEDYTEERLLVFR